jgi:hypothetical protein
VPVVPQFELPGRSRIDRTGLYRQGLFPLSLSHLDDPEYWRKRAQELRDLAVKMGSDEARQQLLNIAADYERLANAAEERERNAPEAPEVRSVPPT